ncbi:MAG: hypothetical protein MHPSP_002376, partial [Paramarteilia canceri]
QNQESDVYSLGAELSGGKLHLCIFETHHKFGQIVLPTLMVYKCYDLKKNLEKIKTLYEFSLQSKSKYLKIGLSLGRATHFSSESLQLNSIIEWNSFDCRSRQKHLIYLQYYFSEIFKEYKTSHQLRPAIISNNMIAGHIILQESQRDVHLCLFLGSKLCITSSEPIKSLTSANVFNSEDIGYVDLKISDYLDMDDYSDSQIISKFITEYDSSLQLSGNNLYKK